MPWVLVVSEAYVIVVVGSVWVGDVMTVDLVCKANVIYHGMM